MNIQGLIERYEKFKANKKKLTSVDLVLKDLRTLDEPEPLPFKSKDVVRRIRGFDPTTQTRWLNDILKELGDDYGSMKYREGYEQGKFEGAWVGNQLKDADKIRQELNKPVIPKFVAKKIDYFKKTDDWGLLRVMDYLFRDKEIKKWLDDKNNQDLVALAWIFGYEVEEEKKFFVKIKCLGEEYKYLNYFKSCREWLFSEKEETKEYRTAHTRKELEEAGFSEVFNSPLFETVEVE